MLHKNDNIWTAFYWFANYSLCNVKQTKFVQKQLGPKNLSRRIKDLKVFKFGKGYSSKIEDVKKFSRRNQPTQYHTLTALTTD